MKVSELRIGNLIQISDKIITMDAKIFHAVIHGFNDYNPEPIPLTADWLVKFGFKDSRILLPGDGEFEIRIHGGTFHIWPTDGQTESYNYRNHINYLHQLQNLYFALTGEELTIKN